MKSVFLKTTIASLILSTTCLVNVANAGLITQWADTVIDFSTEYDNDSWSAEQALGDPNTFAYGDISTAWAPRPSNGTTEFLTLGFNTAVYANGATIRETYGHGFVTQIDVLDTFDVLHTVWAGVDTSLAGVVNDFTVNWTQTSYLVKGLKVHVSTDATSSWEEIDAVQLRGNSISTSIPEPSTLAIFALGLMGLVSRRFKK